MEKTSMLMKELRSQPLATAADTSLCHGQLTGRSGGGSLCGFFSLCGLYSLDFFLKGVLVMQETIAEYANDDTGDTGKGDWVGKYKCLDRGGGGDNWTVACRRCCNNLCGAWFSNHGRSPLKVVASRSLLLIEPLPHAMIRHSDDVCSVRALD
jgi:hypothetical protein